ncbi:MAG: phospholipase/lecithinase/hemolysin [Saprospiraceae bacterium]
MKSSNYLAKHYSIPLCFRNAFASLNKILLILALAASFSVRAQPTYSKVVIFGDSLSDTGNISSVIGSLPPPFYNNRITNGPVAVDELTAKLGLNATPSLHLSVAANGYNYAVAGGKIVGNGTEDLSAQIGAYLNRTNSFVDSNALFLLMLGGNDLLSIRRTSSTNSGNLQIESTIIAYIHQIQRLLNAGARYFLVANAPNIGRIPQTLALESSFAGISARAQSYSQYFNQRLSSALTTLAFTGDSNVILFDFYATFNSITNNPSAHGFSNASEACFIIASLSFHPNCNFSRFVFFDDIHPTGKAHQLLGEAMYKRLLEPTSSNSNGSVVSPIYLLLLSD